MRWVYAVIYAMISGDNIYAEDWSHIEAAISLHNIEAALEVKHWWPLGIQKP